MISLAKHYGGARRIVTSSAVPLVFGDKRVLSIVAGADLDVVLPAPSAFPHMLPGWCLWAVGNLSLHVLTIKDSAGNSLATLTNGFDFGFVSLVDRSSDPGVWSIRVRPAI